MSLNINFFFSKLLMNFKIVVSKYFIQTEFWKTAKINNAFSTYLHCKFCFSLSINRIFILTSPRQNMYIWFLYLRKTVHLARLYNKVTLDAFQYTENVVF